MYFSWAEINLNAFRHNVQALRRMLPKDTKILLPKVRLMTDEMEALPG